MQLRLMYPSTRSSAPHFSEKVNPAMRTAGTRTWATNGLFGAFILAAFGAGLLHAWALQARAGALIHVLVAIPAAALCAVILYRYWRHWPARLAPLYRKSRRGMRSPDAASALGSGLLLLTGLGMAFVIAAGSALLLVVAALGLGLLPWTRIAVCRNHFFVSAALVGTGAVLWLSLSAGPIPQPYYAMSALFCLCMSSLMTVFIVIMHGNRLERMPATGYGWMSD
jgi:hypothetical protein